MSVVITIKDLQAYAEVDYIIKHMNQRYIDKIPEKLLNFFDEMKDSNYEVKINPYVPLQNQNLTQYALEIIALLHLNYWCENEERKQELYGIMLSNENSLQEKIMEKHNIENLFEEFESTSENESNDISQPRVIQKFDKYTKDNIDIQDYTDSDVEEILPSNETESDKKGFFQIIKEKILKLIKKK